MHDEAQDVAIAQGLVEPIAPRAERIVEAQPLPSAHQPRERFLRAAQVGSVGPPSEKRARVVRLATRWKNLEALWIVCLCRFISSRASTQP